ncbi:MAG: hypothetical protein H0V77_12965 [Actinobacteria bacterium]|nr:hypothetical protein [Actinomycetota bacterium]
MTYLGESEPEEQHTYASKYPMRVAKNFLSVFYTGRGGRASLLYRGGKFYEFTDHWEVAETEGVKSKLYLWLDSAFYTDETDIWMRWEPNGRTVGGVMGALKALTFISKDAPLPRLRPTPLEVTEADKRGIPRD